MRRFAVFAVFAVAATLAAVAPCSAWASAPWSWTNATYFNDASLPAADPYVLHDEANGSTTPTPPTAPDDRARLPGRQRSPRRPTWSPRDGYVAVVDYDHDKQAWGDVFDAGGRVSVRIGVLVSPRR